MMFVEEGTLKIGVNVGVVRIGIGGVKKGSVVETGADKVVISAPN
jgi:hypothetical protein